jgi:hypothetical protein
MYYAETGNLEIEFIICDKRNAYLFECKLNDNDDLKLNDTASILQDEVRNLLGDRDLAGRYVIYQGHDKLIEQRGCAVICTNNWDINFEDFEKYVMFQQITNKLGFDIREYNDNDDFSDVYERDNIPNPFDKLSLEELLFLRENNYFLPK